MHKIILSLYSERLLQLLLKKNKLQKMERDYINRDGHIQGKLVDVKGDNESSVQHITVR